jgi:hypothetical protein
MERYRRHVLYLSMVGYLARGDLEAARHVSRFRRGMKFDRTEAIAMALHLPAVVLRAGLRLRSALRSFKT